MASLPDDFDGTADDEPRPLLPREDRIWRHPSELSAEFDLGLDPVAVRSRWIASQPSRASAWTAGFVGALLATGLVVVGTHLGGVLATPPSPGRSASGSPVATTVTPSIAGAKFDAGLTSLVGSAGSSIAVVDVAQANSGSVAKSLGVIVDGSGTVLTAAASVAKAASVLIDLPGEAWSSVGRVVGVDARSGLAVVKVADERGLPPVRFSRTSPTANALAIAIVSPATARKSLSASVTAVRDVDVNASSPLGPLVDADLMSLGAGASPLGSPILDANGSVEGIVVGSAGGHAVVVPAWLAAAVARQLSATGRVAHGWLGISGFSVAAKGHAGVRVLDVAANSAAARAGIRPGDLIVSLNGEPTPSMGALVGRLYVLGAGTPVHIAYYAGARLHRVDPILTSDGS